MHNDIKNHSFRAVGSPLKVALGDLRHRTVGLHSTSMPLGIGYIGAYALSQIGPERLDLRFFTDPEALLNTLDTWRPDILALSNYCWNTNISQLLYRHVKRLDPAILCVSGGPDFPDSPDERQDWLRARPETDFYVYREGERPFTSLLQLLLDGEDPEQIKSRQIAGIISIHPVTKSLVIGSEPDRIKDMDIIPSPYLTGLMDIWFDGNFHPFFETSRGCPFTCAFCVQGEHSWNKVGRFSIERLDAELRYMAERIKPWPNLPLEIGDLNFGQFPWHEELAEHIAAIIEEYNWPQAINGNAGKSHKDRVLRVTQKLGNRFPSYSSLQSMNPATLKAIKRRNLPMETLQQFVKDIKAQGGLVKTEMITPLPEETRDSYIDGLSELFVAGIERVVPYTSMLLKGTELASQQMRELYGMESRFRVIPRQFGDYRGEKCFEIEEVCIATNTMEFDDYLYCRKYSLLMTLFTDQLFDVCHRLLEELGLDKLEWLKGIDAAVNHVPDSGLAIILAEFLRETRQELFPSEQAIYDFFSQPENYQKLLRVEYGDNLMRKYTNAAVNSQYGSALDIAFDVMEKLVEPSQRNHTVGLLDAAKTWTKAIRGGRDMIKNLDTLRVRYQLNLSYDVPHWYAQRELTLERFAKPVKLDIFFEEKRILEFLELGKKLCQTDNVEYIIRHLIANSYCEVNSFWRTGVEIS